MSKLLILVLLFSISCGPGTSTGNPQSSAKMTLQSSAYSDPNSSNILALKSKKRVSAKTKSGKIIQFASDYELKLCVVDVTFVSDSERHEINIYDIGLIDLSDVTQTVTWGEVVSGSDIEFNIIEIWVAADPEVCGVDYSLRYEGEEIDTEFALFFEYEGNYKTNDSDYIRFDPTLIVEAIEDGVNEGYFNNDDWEDYIDDFMGEFEDDDDSDDDSEDEDSDDDSHDFHDEDFCEDDDDSDEDSDDDSE